MSNDDFDNIVNGMGDDDNEEVVDFDSVMEAVFHYYKKLNPGQIPIKGMFIIESTGAVGTGTGRTLDFESSNPTSEWDVLGMLESVSSQIKMQNMLDSLGIFVDDNSAGDDDDDDE